MFKSHSGKHKLASQLEALQFGRELVQDPERNFKLVHLDQLGFDAEIAAISFDPLQSLFAVATQSGRITLYGRPDGLPRCSWTIRPAQAIKHLVLKSGSPFLIVIDVKSTFHIYDISRLDERGEPTSLAVHSLRSLVNCIEYLPSLSHIFLGLQNGGVDTYDTDRLMVSPYRIRNLWADQDELLRRSGVLNAPPKKRIPSCTDVRTHPLDPNQLLIAYEGGIILYNLSEENLVRTYEYIVLPGAPGGHNDQTEAAFLERRPACLCLAWRPDGKVFVSGHDDGTLVFWDVGEGDKPIMARTLTMEDVNLASSSSLFGDNADGPNQDAQQEREPIFKMAWSGFPDNTSVFDAMFAGSNAKKSAAASEASHSGTMLTVLGGLLPGDPKGLHVLHFPPYSAPSLLAGGQPAQLRVALRTSVKPMYSTVVPSDTSPEDFLLLSRSPYYGQAYDPYSVALLLSSDGDLPKIAPHTERGFAAFTFPPVPGKDAKELDLPVELHLAGSQSVVACEAVTVPSLTHKRFATEGARSRFPLEGGSFQAGKSASGRAGRAHQDHHAILTAHIDMSLRLWDCSTATSQLLTGFSAREALSDDQLMAYLEGKVVIEHLSPAWDTGELALGLSTGEVLLFRFGYAKPSAVLEKQEQEEKQHYNPVQVVSLESHSGHLDVEMAAAAQALELDRQKTKSPGTFLSRRLRSSASSPRDAKGKGPAVGQSNTFEVDVGDTSTSADWTANGYKPVVSISAPKLSDRRMSALALSEAGFLAVAWGERIAIMDLRGPELLFHEGPDRPEQGGVALLTWTICSEGDGLDRHPRLLVSYRSGQTKVYTLAFTLDMWIVETRVGTIVHNSLHNPLGVFVLDTHGNSLGMSADSLDAYLRAQERERAGEHIASGHHASGALNTILIVVSETSINVIANLTGERLLKLDFTAGRATAAKIVRRYGTPVLVVVMADGTLTVYALPSCEPIRNLRLQYERSRASISPEGRILQTLSPTFFQLNTIFSDQVPAPVKSVSYYDMNRVLPPQPTASVYAAASTAAASYVSSWFGSSSAAARALVPAKLDDILGGPERPPPKVRIPGQSDPGTQETGGVVASAGAPPMRPPRNRPVPSAPAGSSSSAAGLSGRRVPDMPEVEEVEYNAFGMPKRKPGAAARRLREGGDEGSEGGSGTLGDSLGNMGNALHERGEKLDFLNEQFDRATQASQDFMQQARRTAMMQGAKSAVTGTAKGAMYGIGKLF